MAIAIAVLEIQVVDLIERLTVQNKQIGSLINMMQRSIKDEKTVVTILNGLNARIIALEKRPRINLSPSLN